MENSTKLILAGVSLMVVAVLVGVIMKFTNIGTDLTNKAGSSLQSSLEGLDDSDKSLYDNTVSSGDQVIAAIGKYLADPQCKVIVCTKGTSGTACWQMYSDTFKGGGISSTMTTFTTTMKSCVGFPTTDALGQPIGAADADSKAVAEALAGILDASVSAAGASNETGGYDATTDSSAQWYIAPSAQFKSTLQKDQNNAVRFITFVQQ